ncbi:MvdC/MvdD family ATP grasp protein [Streptomyces sp. NPDC006476]|uniref:MvdC/MvdD family ATP grasp protein n=1 Tax=Streptomyces sp. NPDC006476 TaxID=3157175 RepID=UPI0033A86531
MSVLILTSEQDVTADMVVAKLNGRGVPVVRLAAINLPGRAALSSEYTHGTFHGYLSTESRLVCMRSLRSIWVRRPGIPASGVAEPSEWPTDESSQLLYAMLRCTDARWMNHPDAAIRARHKPWQVRVAQHSRLPVPATLITTCPQAARDFAARFPDLVIKSLSGTEPQDPHGVLPTSRGGPDEAFAAVSFGPTLLQRRVSKRAEIRLTAVGNRFFAARKAAGPDLDQSEVDVPYADSTAPWQPVYVPSSIGDGVRAYLRQAELFYGAFDFAEDDYGIWWFLECDQSGQFGFVEMETGQPIAQAIADWLTAPGCLEEASAHTQVELVESGGP